MRLRHKPTRWSLQADLVHRNERAIEGVLAISRDEAYWDGPHISCFPDVPRSYIQPGFFSGTTAIPWRMLS